jgi:pSer/pThr/pTyr-binding forkhead associated (FHA) protein
MAQLILNRDGVDLGTHELVPDMVMIGRAPLNHIIIDDPTVSAHHARLVRAADSYWLMDLHSTNGTQVNRVSITDAKLKDGDEIRFGSVIAVFAGPLPQTVVSPRVGTAKPHSGVWAIAQSFLKERFRFPRSTPSI